MLHPHASSLHTVQIFSTGSGARVTVYGMSRTEGQDPGGTDPIDLQLPRGSNWQQSNADDRAVDTTIDSTRNAFDRHEEIVASDAISWRQGKFSWLEMVLLDCSASNLETTL